MGARTIQVLSVLFLLAGGLASAAQNERPEDGLEIEIPLRIATLGGGEPGPQLGAALEIPDLAEADKQVSTVLLRALHALGLLIESPKLDLDAFLRQDEEWRSSIQELPSDVIHDHNTYARSEGLPPGRIYGVRYAGRYRYARASLKLVLVISLFERGQLGSFRQVSSPYSRHFFMARLESAIKAELRARAGLK